MRERKRHRSRLALEVTPRDVILTGIDDGTGCDESTVLATREIQGKVLMLTDRGSVSFTPHQRVVLVST